MASCRSHFALAHVQDVQFGGCARSPSLGESGEARGFGGIPRSSPMLIRGRGGPRAYPVAFTVPRLAEQHRCLLGKSWQCPWAHKRNAQHGIGEFGSGLLFRLEDEHNYFTILFMCDRDGISSKKHYRGGRMRCSGQARCW